MCRRRIAQAVEAGFRGVCVQRQQMRASCRHTEGYMRAKMKRGNRLANIKSLLSAMVEKPALGEVGVVWSDVV